MTSLGPAPAPPLQPLRPESRDSRERERHATPHKAPLQGSPKHDAELESVADFGKDEETHQLDERA